MTTISGLSTSILGDLGVSCKGTKLTWQISSSNNFCFNFCPVKFILHKLTPPGSLRMNFRMNFSCKMILNILTKYMYQIFEFKMNIKKLSSTCEEFEFRGWNDAAFRLGQDTHQIFFEFQQNRWASCSKSRLRSQDVSSLFLYRRRIPNRMFTSYML